ncbi:hypothetical protein [Shinella sp. M27]|uniref:hypothetical protein n=1 Tax=Shinella sp. M27 TaxID=3368614 RepID=UPI003BA02923
MMVSPSLPYEYFILAETRRAGPIAGSVRDRSIYSAVIDGHGRRYGFVGLAGRDRNGRLNVLSLRQGEWIVAPDLIYREIS